jgi:hypothetical protein
MQFIILNGTQDYESDNFDTTFIDTWFCGNNVQWWNFVETTTIKRRFFKDKCRVVSFLAREVKEVLNANQKKSWLLETREQVMPRKMKDDRKMLL